MQTGNHAEPESNKTHIADASEQNENTESSGKTLFELVPEPNSEPGAITATVNDSGKQKRKFMNNWNIALLIVATLLLSIVIVSYQNTPELSEEIRSKLAEVEKMKQELERMHGQTEAMQRERDAALATAQQQEKQRAQEAQAALEAANRETEAMAAAALAAEKALETTREAEELAKKQRLEERRLSDERKRLQLDKQQAELEQQRLTQERQQSELEKERNELERIRKDKLEQQERERLVAKEQAELFKSLEEIDSAESVVSDKPEQKTQTNESSFNTDPCSSPSAKFLSTCK